MIVDSPTINQIITNVFEDMLALNTEFEKRNSNSHEENRVVAAIHISGSLEGTLVVDAPDSTASRIGETMFNAGEGTLEEEEILDAVGEIANMIGGNIKGLSIEDSALSLPFVARESGATDEIAMDGEWASIRVDNMPLRVCWHSPAE